MRYSSSFVSARSMAIRVSRKLGIPLKSGLAARWRRTCSMPRRSSSRLTLSSTSWRSTVQPPFGTQRREFFARLQIMLHFLKEPRAAEAGTAYHDGVHTVEVEALFGPLGSGDITVADDGNVHAWVLFHLADKCPVRLAGIHLGAGTAVDGEGGKRSPATVRQGLR